MFAYISTGSIIDFFFLLNIIILRWVWVLIVNFKKNKPTNGLTLKSTVDFRLVIQNDYLRHDNDTEVQPVPGISQKSELPYAEPSS